MNTDYFLNQQTNPANAASDGNAVTMLDETGLGLFTSALSGRTPDGRSKAKISYQAYALEDPQDSADRSRIYTLSTACAELSIDQKNPGFFVLDVIFQSCHDPELKLFWARLQQHKRNIAQNPEKTWIFYINLLEMASVSVRSDHEDLLVTGNVLNPLIFYLTREVPNQMIEENQEKRIHRDQESDELQGGNIVRMLIADNLVQFQINNSLDTREIKGQVEREEQEKRYINSKPDQPTSLF